LPAAREIINKNNALEIIAKLFFSVNKHTIQHVFDKKARGKEKCAFFIAKTGVIPPMRT